MANQLLRYEHVRRADSLDDQKTAIAIVTSESVSTTQEQLQEFVISQLKRIIFGNNFGKWYNDFIVGGIRSLADISAAIGPGPVVNPITHPQLRQLIHFIEEGPAEGFPSGATKQILPSGEPFPTQVIWWLDVGMTKKIVDKTVTRNFNKTPSTIVWRMFDVNGTTILTTITDIITYSGVFEVNRVRTII